MMGNPKPASLYRSVQVIACQFASSKAKIAFLISLLSSETLVWVTLSGNVQTPIMSNLQDFLTPFQKNLE